MTNYGVSTGHAIDIKLCETLNSARETRECLIDLRHEYEVECGWAVAITLIFIAGLFFWIWWMD
jgi:hypothetical protein